MTTGTKLGLKGTCNGEQNCGFILDSLLEFYTAVYMYPVYISVNNWRKE